MGQKVNPHGLRVGVIKDWNSKWYADTKDEEFSNNLVEDYNIRKYLKKKLYNANVAKINIERTVDKVKVIVFTAKPGIIIGKGGAEIEKLKKDVQKLTVKKLFIDIKEIKKPDTDAQLVVSRQAYPVVSVVLIWQEKRHTARVQFLFRHFVLTLTMDLLKQIQHMERLA